jgi:hypothetical protein
VYGFRFKGEKKASIIGVQMVERKKRTTKEL